MRMTATTYKDMEKCVRVFKNGTFNVLFVIGHPGQSKTTIVTKVLKDARVICGGSVTPFQLYRELWYNKGSIFVLDDVESMYRDKGLVQLLKALCETKKEKVIQWMTAAPQLEAEGIEREFTTKSRVVIILNEWTTLSQHIQALEDRGLMLLFRPSVEEVMRLGRKFITDKEVLGFVEDNKPYIDNLSLRALLIAVEMKTAGLPWRDSLVESLGIKTILLMQELCEDKSFIRDEDRIKRWTELTGDGSRPGLGRTSFFKTKRRFTELNTLYGAKK